MSGKATGQVAVSLNEELAPAALPDEPAVEAWLRALIAAGINFHPEESFRELVDVRTGARCFGVEDARRLDRLMDRAYELCDPCEVAVRVFEAAERCGQSDGGQPRERSGV
jgi:hypothetical protein